MSSVTASDMASADAYNDDHMEDPMAYLNAYNSSNEEEEPTAYPHFLCDEEEQLNNKWWTIPKP